MSYSCFTSPKPLLLPEHKAIKEAWQHPKTKCMQFLDVAEEIYSGSLMHFKGLKEYALLSFIFKKMRLAEIPKWVICLHSSKNETANVFIMSLSPCLFFLATYIHKTFEKLSCTLPFPSPLGV